MAQPAVVSGQRFCSFIAPFRLSGFSDLLSSLGQSIFASSLGRAHALASCRIMPVFGSSAGSRRTEDGHGRITRHNSSGLDAQLLANGWAPRAWQSSQSVSSRMRLLSRRGCRHAAGLTLTCLRAEWRFLTLHLWKYFSGFSVIRIQESFFFDNAGTQAFASLAGLRSPGPTLFVTTSDYTRPEMVQKLVEGLEEHRVRFVLWDASFDVPSDSGVPSDHQGPLRSYLHTHYRVIKTFPGLIQVWREAMVRLNKPQARMHREMSANMTTANGGGAAVPRTVLPRPGYWITGVCVVFLATLGGAAVSILFHDGKQWVLLMALAVGMTLWGLERLEVSYVASSLPSWISWPMSCWRWVWFQWLLLLPATPRSTVTSSATTLATFIISIVFRWSHFCDYSIPTWRKFSGAILGRSYALFTDSTTWWPTELSAFTPSLIT